MKLKRWCVVFLAAATAIGVADPVGAQGTLSLVEAQRLALDQSPQIAGQRLGVGAAREMAIASAQLPDPVLSLGIENMPVEGADKFSLTRDFMTMRRIGIMQEVTRREKRDLKAQRQELEASRGEAEIEVSRALIQRDVATAWLDAWFSEAMARVIVEQRARAANEVEAAEIQYRAGRGSQADVLMARSNLALIDDRAADQQRRVRAARTLLARWLGPAAGRPLDGFPDLTRLKPHLHALREFLERHPQIAVLQAQERIATAEARLAQANRTPDWSVELAYNVRGSAFGDMVSIGVSIPLPWDRANRQDREVAAKLAMAGQAQANREEALRQHAAEIGAMVLEWESNRERLQRFTREIEPLASARTGAVETAYRGGKAALPDVLAALRAELDVRIQALQLEQETARLWAQLNYLVPEAP